MERGISRIGALFALLIFGAFVYLGYQVFPILYCYSEIQGFMDSQAVKAQVLTDAEIRRNVLAKIRELELPIDDPEDLKVYRANEKLVLELQYQEVVYLELDENHIYDLYTFDLHARAEGKAQ